MNIPGANLLDLALQVIAPQSMTHRAASSRSINDAGDFVSTFAAPVEIEGSMQPVNKKLYQQLGLNLARNYSYLFTSADVRPTARGRQGDLLTYDGRTWQCESDLDWRGADGWRKLLCVEVPNP